jgi:hypothetical protein
MKNLPEILDQYFNWKTLTGALFFAAGLFAALLMLLWAFTPERPSRGVATAVLNIIPAPTATSPASQPEPPSAPTQTPDPTAAPGNLAIGAYVQISGTEGDGLRLRSAPGLEGVVRFLAIESEVFQVTDGPREVDGYTWWYLTAPSDGTVQGWAVANYLAVIQNP